ncbi:unnamed protein product [Ectocarpus fasciculatus]
MRKDSAVGFKQRKRRPYSGPLVRSYGGPTPLISRRRHCFLHGLVGTADWHYSAVCPCSWSPQSLDPSALYTLSEEGHVALCSILISCRRASARSRHTEMQQHQPFLLKRTTTTTQTSSTSCLWPDGPTARQRCGCRRHNESGPCQQWLLHGEAKTTPRPGCSRIRWQCGPCPF